MNKFGSRLIGIFPVLFLLAGTKSLEAQPPSVSFSHIGARNGMSSNWVTALCQDADGFMWIGTNRGLNRFDGYNMVVFESHSDDSTSLSNNNISCIREDSHQNLWVGTTFGINKKESGAQSFQQISLFDYNAFRCNDVNNINDIFVDQKGTVYVGTHEGFFTYAENAFRHHLVDSADFAARVNNILSFAEDRNGCIWMGTSTTDLVRYAPAGGPLEFIPLPSLYEGKYVSGQQKLFIDSENLLWIGSQAGMYVYDLQKGRWHDSLNQSLYNMIGSKLITGIQEDKDGMIWLTTDGAGIFLYNKKEKTAANFSYMAGDPESISTNGLYCLLIGRDQMVWVGTYKQGLDFYKPNSRKFRLIQHDPKNSNSLGLNDVDCFMEDSNGDIWIGTNGAGVSILDKETGDFRHIRASGAKGGLSSNVVVSLYEDHEKNIWMGTYFGGLNKMDPETGRFTVYKHNVADTTSLSDDRIWSIIEDGYNNLWIGTMGGGLNRFEPETGSFRRYTSENSNLIGNYVNHLSLDSGKRLWICTSNGLSIYNPQKDNFENYINKDSDAGTNSFGSLISAFTDTRGWNWLCSSNGLIRFDPEKHTAAVIDKDSGLMSNSVHRMLEDQQGNLWVSSTGGISKIMISDRDQNSNFRVNFIHFDEADGLQDIEFSETTSLLTKDGEFLFGGVNGVNIFRPEEIIMDRTAPSLAFTNLKILNTVIVPGQIYNNRIIIDKCINHTDRIVLKHSENLFSIEFVALTWLFPEKNQYRYQLEGFDENWFETDGTANFATFTNLNHGDYVFRLQGSNADGTWNQEGISLKIKVLPPFLKTWYALLIYIFILLVALLSLRYMILFRERMKVELETERSEAKRVHDLDMLKLKFFTNISHEFLTPLTLILSPVEKLLPVLKGASEKKYLDHIYQNTRKLQLMVSQLLDFRKMDAQGLVFNPSWGDIVAFITSTVASFSDLSENKHIELRMITDLREFYMMFDKDKLERILFNLLSNAFKFTPVSGVVIVQAGLEEVTASEGSQVKTNLIIRVKDNGTGINPENLDKIFTRFYQEENPKAVGAKGTGIGLSLTKEYVQLHRGEITVESALNIGSCFSVFLPVDQPVGLKNKAVHGFMHETKFNAGKLTGLPELRIEMSQENRQVILIVEDHEDLRLYLKENLEDEYEVLEAGNGKHALAILEKRLPDLILSDIMMPEMDGIEFCRHVKNDKITCHIPLIFLTAKISERQELEGLKTGADEYIVKPFNLDILRTKIDNLMRLKQNLREVFKTKMQIEPRDISITSLDEKFMKKALDIIEEHMADAAFSVNGFSKLMGTSRMQLYNKIVSLTGTTPLEFIRVLRLKRAAQLLDKSQLTVSEVAYQVGFNDPRYFSMQFKKEFRVLPSKFKPSRES